MTCPHCGADGVRADLLLCPRCFSNLTLLPAAAPVEDVAPAMETAAPAGTGICPREWCAEPYPPGVTTCPRCANPVPLIAAPSASATGISAVRLQLPDGATVGIRPRAVVAIGRESPDARIADGLAPYDGVSRLHAELTVDDTGVELVDVGSVNGTTVDGRLAGRRSVALDPGPHEIRLGKAAVLVIDVIAGGRS